MANKVKSFFLKAALLCLPLLGILLVYVITDPFKVIRKYHFDNYYNWQHWELNRELAGVSNLEERLHRNDIPDSYIFGNSRSLVFRCPTWADVLHDGAKPYHFDAASESLFGVYHKVKFLDHNNITIRNALMVCDVSLFSKTVNDHDVTHMKHPDISGESEYAFQVNFLKGYFSNLFFLKQMDYLIFGKVRNYMKDIFAIEQGYIRTEPYLNDYIYQKYDSILAVDSSGYYVFKADVFYDRPAMQEVSEPVIGSKQIVMLREMKAIFDKNNTRFKMVISPLYDQKKINGADVNTLKAIFGENAVYDYSGQNDITYTKSHYYESSHFKPYIANRILTEIYTN